MNKNITIFCKRNQKCCCICLILAIIAMLIVTCSHNPLGTFSKEDYINYFQENKEYFETIANYVEQNPDVYFCVSYVDIEDIYEITDDKVVESIHNILNDGMLKEISGNGHTPSVVFKASILFERPERFVSINFSLKSLTNKTLWLDNDKTTKVYEYSRIEKGWYCCYRIQ